MAVSDKTHTPGVMLGVSEREGPQVALHDTNQKPRLTLKVINNNPGMVLTKKDDAQGILLAVTDNRQRPAPGRQRLEAWAEPLSQPC